MPAMSKNTDGACAQRAFSSATGRSGAQLRPTNALARTTAAARTLVIATTKILMAWARQGLANNDLAFHCEIRSDGATGFLITPMPPLRWKYAECLQWVVTAN